MPLCENHGPYDTRCDVCEEMRSERARTAQFPGIKAQCPGASLERWSFAKKRPPTIRILGQGNSDFPRHYISGTASRKDAVEVTSLGIPILPGMDYAELERRCRDVIEATYPEIKVFAAILRRAQKIDELQLTPEARTSLLELLEEAEKEQDPAKRIREICAALRARG